MLFTKKVNNAVEMSSQLMKNLNFLECFTWFVWLWTNFNSPAQVQNRADV